MGLFDILNNPAFRETITQVAGQVAGQAGNSLRNFGQNIANGQGGGLLGAGALGALLGTMMPKGGMKAAGLLGIGALALNFYKQWSAQNAQAKEAPKESGFFAYSGPQSASQASADPTAMMVLRTMVYAARADGHVDSEEEARIAKLLPQFFPDQDVTPILKGLMEEPINPSLLAREVQSEEQALDLYRLSCIIMDIDHFMERGYLAELGKSLNLSADRMQALEKEAEIVREKLAEL